MRFLLIGFSIAAFSFGAIALFANIDLDKSPELKKLVTEMASYNCITGAEMDERGHKNGPTIPDQWMRYEQMAKTATTSQLIFLANYKNAVVRCYAFKALVSRNSSSVFQVLSDHLHDTAMVVTIQPCIRGEEMVVENFCKEAFDSLNKEQKSAVANILLNDDLLTISRTDWTLKALQPIPDNYMKLRELVEKKKDLYALIALARYHKLEDRKLIASFLKKNQTPDIVFTAIKMFPDQYFFADLKEISTYPWGVKSLGWTAVVALYQALAKYPTKQTVEVFEQTIAENNRGKCIALLAAIKKYPDPLFEPLKEKIVIAYNMKPNVTHILASKDE